MIKDIFGHEYTRIIKDPMFEQRLKTFDPTLRLLFDQVDKKFKILGRYTDNSGWYIVLTLEAGEELDENIISLLFERRKAYQEKIAGKSTDVWYKSFLSESAEVKTRMEDKSSENHKLRLLDDRTSWRKAARELRNFPVSDVTAGYPKVNYKPKGEIICVSK